MPTFITLPCGTSLKASGISRLIPMDSEQQDINRRCTKPKVVVHHGPTKINVEFKDIESRNAWAASIIDTLNSPSKQ